MKKVMADDLRARYNENGNAIIPNTFQHPNIFIDKLMYFLTPEENVCLTWAVRRILGFQANIMSRRDNISLSQFTDGIVAEDGHWLSRGCGLGVNTIRAALECLEKYKVLIPTSSKPNPVKGQEYWLQDNQNAIDWDALEERKSVKISQYQQRTAKATEKSLKSRGYVGRKAPITSDVRQGVTSDVNTKPTETHRKKERATPVAPSNSKQKATDIPAVVLYREVTGAYPVKACWSAVVDAMAKTGARLGRDAAKDDLLPFYVFWCGKGWNPKNIDWLDYAIKGNTEYSKPATTPTLQPKVAASRSFPKYIDGKAVFDA